MIWSPHMANAVHRAWPSSRVRMVKQARHVLPEPEVTAALVGIMDGHRAAG
jgi:hypothetical protein